MIKTTKNFFVMIKNQGFSSLFQRRQTLIQIYGVSPLGNHVFYLNCEIKKKHEEHATLREHSELKCRKKVHFMDEIPCQGFAGSGFGQLGSGLLIFHF